MKKNGLIIYRKKFMLDCASAEQLKLTFPNLWKVNGKQWDILAQKKML